MAPKIGGLPGPPVSRRTVADTLSAVLVTDHVEPESFRPSSLTPINLGLQKVTFLGESIYQFQMIPLSNLYHLFLAQQSPRANQQNNCHDKDVNAQSYFR